MKVKCVYNKNLTDLTEEKLYSVVGLERHNWIKVVDDSGEVFMYPPVCFEEIRI